MAAPHSVTCKKCGRPKFGSFDRFRLWTGPGGRLVKTCAACARASARRSWRRRHPMAREPLCEHGYVYVRRCPDCMDTAALRPLAMMGDLLGLSWPTT
jgi:hypothetical protein